MFSPCSFSASCVCKQLSTLVGAARDGAKNLDKRSTEAKPHHDSVKWESCTKEWRFLRDVLHHSAASCESFVASESGRLLCKHVSR